MLLRPTGRIYNPLRGMWETPAARIPARSVWTVCTGSRSASRGCQTKSNYPRRCKAKAAPSTLLISALALLRHTRSSALTCGGCRAALTRLKLRCSHVTRPHVISSSIITLKRQKETPRAQWEERGGAKLRETGRKLAMKHR